MHGDRTKRAARPGITVIGRARRTPLLGITHLATAIEEGRPARAGHQTPGRAHAVAPSGIAIMATAIERERPA